MTGDGTPISDETEGARRAAQEASRAVEELYRRIADGGDVAVAELDVARQAADQAASRYQLLLLADLADPPTGLVQP